MKRGIWIGIIVVILIILGILFYPHSQKVNDEPVIVGGDKDSHGCIGSAGYSWCEVKQKCIRVWEEFCDIDAEAKTLCNVGTTVSVCGNYIRVTRAEALDAPTLLYKFNANATPITCNAFDISTKVPEECYTSCKDIFVKQIC